MSKSLMAIREWLRKQSLEVRLFCYAAAVLLPLLAGIFLFLVLFSPESLDIYRPADSPTLRAHFAAMREAGYPMTMAELEAWYEPVAPEDDAEPLLETVMKFIGPPRASRPGFNGALYFIKSRLDSDAPFREVKAASGLINLLRNDRPLRGKRYSQFQRVGMEGSWTRDAGPMEPDFTWPPWYVSRLTPLLGLDAVARAESGDGDGALLSLMCMLDVAQTLRGELSFELHDWRYSPLDFLPFVLGRVLSVSRPSEARMLELQLTLAEMDSPDPLLRALVAEQYVAIARLQGVETAGDQRGTQKYYWAPDPYETENRSRRHGITTEDLETLLKFTTREIEAFVLPESERRNADSSFWDERKRAVPGQRGWFHYRRLALETFKLRTQKFMAASGVIRVLVAALAVERFERAEGRYPEDLQPVQDDYSPISLEDPYAGEFLNLTIDASGYTIESVRGSRFHKVVVQRNP